MGYRVRKLSTSYLGLPLGFKGEDTRNSFTAHLYKQLCQKGINVFIDDKKLKVGQAITPALVTAIENSTASVGLLSEIYASSSWCLGELVKMSAGEQRDRGFFQFSIRSIHQMWGIKGANLEKPWLNMKRIWRIGRWCGFGGMLLDKLPIYLWLGFKELGPVVRFFKKMSEFILRNLIQSTSRITARTQLTSRHDNDIVRNLISVANSIKASIQSASPNDIMRDLIKLTAEIGALIELIDPDDDAIVRDLTQLASEISALMKLIGPLDDAVVRDLIRLASEVEARETHQVPSRADKRLQRRMEESCEDVFHGSPATIFCESKLSDLRSCEVGRIGNPLNWGDGVVRKVVLAEVVGEEAGKGKTLRMEDFEDRR
uniref:TIR domain-containing protein n=1 Tax=Vitis vinifera TaxID=29760 RepID=A5AI81_VITVI|nr:hypothetical protein VITISV_028499 [Vitis vinifera]